MLFNVFLFSPCNDFDEEGVVVRADDGAGERAGRVQPDTHTFAWSEDLVQKNRTISNNSEIPFTENS